MSSGVSPARLIACGRGRGAERRGRLVGCGDASFADPGALDDPRVVVSTPGFEVGVGQPPSGTAIPQPTMEIGRPMRPLTRLATTRSADRSAGVHPDAQACPSACRRTGCAPGIDVPGPSTTPISSPRVRSTPSATPSERNTPTAGATIMRSGTASVSPAGDGWARVRSRQDLREVAVDVVRACAHGEHRRTSGTVRLATPAIIEPWPTSTNASAPSCASVSIDVAPAHRRPSTCIGRSGAPAVGVGVRGAVVVRDDRRARRARTDVGERGRESVAARRHERRVERATDVERHRASHAELLGAVDRGVDTVGRSRDDDLARARCRSRSSTRRARPCTRRSACSTVAPSSAAMRPGCASAAACVSSARVVPRTARRLRGRARPMRSAR